MLSYLTLELIGNKSKVFSKVFFFKFIFGPYVLFIPY